ncbi:hypothetical protein ILUMI_22495 [Ignelater luminosus]|uniref:Exosome complex component RRP45 n=1 Tax=Ignelater luminosus TaxID=2038154 RepID=A0A8K0FXE0_IGNLU|nr:hypothetical protein ILUMI_22495 [Ignelater luminosus]
MAKIRESIISNCEKKFLIKGLEEHRRLDGRAFDEFRELHIEFSKDWGCCYVTLGKTAVLAQVSCEIQQPKSSRPSEGILIINVELSPMSAPHFEPGRQSELSVQLNRILEKCIKDSKAVDLESLCIKVNEKVWALKVNVNVLNHEGNIADCASIAALSALAHFRRPDISSDGEEIVVHTYAQRDPIPTAVHHYPVCVTYAMFNEGAVILADPTLLEEGVADAHLMIGLNAYKELCGLHLGGNALMTPQSILQCTSKAAARASVVIQQIKEALEKDQERRNQNKEFIFEDSVQFDKAASASNLGFYLDKWSTKQQKKRKNVKHVKEESGMENSTEDSNKGTVESFGKGSAVLLPPEDDNNWKTSSDEESESDIIPDDCLIKGDDKEYNKSKTKKKKLIK